MPERVSARAILAGARVLLLAGPACIAGLTALTALTTGVARAQDADEIIEPLDLGLTERTGRQLLFLDVEAVDDDGLPLPGLSRDDFRIKLDYVWRDLYSVDNLCPCSRSGPAPDGVSRSNEWSATPGVAVAAGEGSSTSDPALQAVGRSDRVFVLYLDFSALQLDGRAAALAQARRFVSEVKQADDRVMIVAYSGIAGLDTRSTLTTDRDALLRTLDVIDADADLLDPFPSGLTDRIETCRTGTVSCYATARRDYFQTRRSFRTLMYFLTLLDDIPERKVLLFFHQNNAIQSGNLYARGEAGRTMRDGTSSGLVPDNLKLLGRLAGTATSSRTAIYPIVSGGASPWSVNVGANLADFTGGAYNRGAGDIAAVVDGAGRGCACIYRLGLEAPERSRSKVYRAKIRAGDTILPSRYRLQYMTDYDRWERRALAVLNSPQDATDLPIHAALVPVETTDGKWRLSVQAAIDIKALELAPEDGKWVGEWEVGALLSDERGRETWEMLAVSRIQRRSDTPSATVVLHERVVEGLAPGAYELRAFVRARPANTLGGARATLELPEAASGDMTVPLILRPRQAHLRTELPFLKGQRLDAPWQELEPRVGSIPLQSESAWSGRQLQFVTWACPGPTGSDVARALESPAPELDPTRGSTEAAGDCVVIRDEADASDWPAGNYTYRIHFLDAAAKPARRPFAIAAPRAAE